MLQSNVTVENGLKYLNIFKSSEISGIFPKPKIEVMKLVFYDDPPFSVADEKGKIQGVEGEFIDEFVKRFKIQYKIFNENTKKFNMKTLEKFDLNLSRFYKLMANYIFVVHEKALLNDFADLCMLVPKNIPVSAIENLQSPFDLVIMILMGISVTLIVILWRVFKAMQREEDVTLIDVCFAVVKTLIGEFLDF